MSKKFKAVRGEIGEARAVAFDGCHKIYLAMDDDSERWLEQEGYIVARGGSDLMLEAVKDWYRNSCSLRFVQGVRHLPDYATFAFQDLVPQGA